MCFFRFPLIPTILFLLVTMHSYKILKKLTAEVRISASFAGYLLLQITYCKGAHFMSKY